MTRRPPRSTLFPYPPLFRSQLADEPVQLGRRHARRVAVEQLRRLAEQPRDAAARGRRDSDEIGPRRLAAARQDGGARSEEHTSELQSLAYLVCRLLPEQNKT